MILCFGFAFSDGVIACSVRPTVFLAAAATGGLGSGWSYFGFVAEGT